MHLSGPADHWIDRDPVSTHWSELGFEGGFDLLLRLKDEALHLALESQADTGGRVGADPARAVLRLATSAVTASLANSIDASGGIDIDFEQPRQFPAKALLYERLVGWKSAEIYKVFFEALSLHAGRRPEQVDGMARFGHHVGLCIQLLDDVGGVWETGQDLQAPTTKMLFPMAYALNSGNPCEAEITAQLRRPPDERDLAGLQDLFTASGARDFLSFYLEERRLRCERALACVGGQARRSLLQWFDAYFCGFRRQTEAGAG